MNGKVTATIAVSMLLVVFAITGRAAPGDLDATFGTGGVVVRPVMAIGHYRFPTSILVQPDGKILVAGQIDEYGDMVSFLIARFDRSGAPDHSFGYQGMIFPPIEYGSACVGAGIALQPDGNIIAVGQHGNEIAVHRYHTDGTADTSFGDGGSMVFARPDADVAAANSVVLRPDGKIVIAGYAWGKGYDTLGIIARLDPDGSLDESFGQGGMISTALGGWTQIYKVLLQPDGKILAIGEHRAGLNSAPSDIAIMRFADDGSVDTSFGDNGRVLASHGVRDFYSAGDLQPDGKIVIASWGYNDPTSTDYRKLVRYNNDGSVDVSFAAPVSASPIHRVNGLTLQPDGKVVTFGYAGFPDAPHLGISIVRLHPTGSMDTSFGTNGAAVTMIDSGNYGAFAGVVQADGNIVVLGTRLNSYKSYEFVIARYQGDPTFSVSGRVTTPGGQAVRNATVILTDPVGVERQATTSSFGLYTFENLRLGATYSIGARSKRYRFSPRPIQVDGNLSDVDLVGLE